MFITHKPGIAEVMGMNKLIVKPIAVINYTAPNNTLAGLFFIRPIKWLLHP